LILFATLVGGIVATTWQARIAQRRFADVRKLARAVVFDYHDLIAPLAGSTPVRERLVRDALEYLNNLAREAADDRELLREIATAYAKVARSRAIRIIPTSATRIARCRAIARR
jgi:non-specific serine/threonine protein kinase/serine/threonine-protein kinase